MDTYEKMKWLNRKGYLEITETDTIPALKYTSGGKELTLVLTSSGLFRYGDIETAMKNAGTNFIAGINNQYDDQL